MFNIKKSIINIKNKILLKLIQSINRHYIESTKECEKDNTYKYENLMPKCTIDDKYKQYFETIDWALENYDIRNIALTGVYGSGKSTILKIYEKSRKQYKYLNISMATFNDGIKRNMDDVEGNSKKSYIDNSVIEKGILQQMFYKVKRKSIPYSRFKRIKNYKFGIEMLKIIGWLFTICFGIILFKPEIISGFKNNIMYIADSLNINIIIIHLIEAFIFLFIATILTSIMICLKKDFKITKISTNAADAELDDSEKSIFNKNIDEILYFFEVNKYNVVVFEDLDRFNNIEIFSNLRELNLLINNSEDINRRVVFIYAIKDNMFCNEQHKDDKFHYKNRTKFFDFIIPVVQVANTSNTCDLMIKKFKNSQLEGTISEDVISEISFLIDDMRVLKNIFNEYVIYNSNLNNEDTNNLNKDKLLAIIVYKNMYPVDFAKLQNNEGIVYKIFDNKHKIIADKKNKLEEECDNLKNEIKLAEIECAKNMSELRAIYATYILNILNITNIIINGVDYSYKQLIAEDVFTKFLETGENRIKGYNGSYRYDLDKVQEQKIKEKKEEYLKRENVVKLKEENVKPDVLNYLKQQLENKNKKIALVNSLPLKELIDDSNINELFDVDEDNTDLIRFLIKRGYIDENYYEYISYFYGVSITPKDRKFIQNITFEKDVDFESLIDKPKNVMKQLHAYMFENKYILNFNLLNYIIQNKKENEEYEIYYNLIIEQLSNEKSISVSFIEKYVERGENINIFFKSLCNKWDNMWQYIQNESNFTKEKKDNYLKYIIEFADESDIEKMNKNSIIANYISELPSFLNLMSEEKYFEKVKKIIGILDVKFKQIEMNTPKFELLDFVYNENRYYISKETIELIIKLYSKEENIENLNVCNYTTVKNSGCEQLIQYINDNINIYVENVFLKLETNVEESVDIMIELLEMEKILKENKEAMIKKEKIKIENIKSVDKSLWETLVVNKKININWPNIIEYYLKVNKIDKILCNCLNEKENYIELSKLKLNENKNFQDNTYQKVSNQLIKCNDIKLESFKELVKSIPFKYDDLKFDDLSKNRINTLIKNLNLTLTIENYNLVKENYSESLVLLITYNIDEYLSNKNIYKLNLKQVIELIDSSITLENKSSVLQNIEGLFIEKDDESSKKIVEFLLTNSVVVNIELVEKLLESEITKDKKIMLIINQIAGINKSQTFKLLKLLGDPYSQTAELGKKPLLEISNVNEKLVRKLQENEYISSFSREKNGLRIYTYQKE